MENKSVINKSEVLYSEIVKGQSLTSLGCKTSVPQINIKCETEAVIESSQQKKRSWKLLNPEQSRNFVKNAKFTFFAKGSIPLITQNKTSVSATSGPLVSKSPASGLYPKEPQPSTSGYKPKVKEPEPSTSGYKAKEPQPSTSGYKPKSNEPQPSTSGYQPESKEPQPSTSGYKPKVEDPPPSTSGYKPKVEEPQPSTSDNKPKVATSVIETRASKKANMNIIQNKMFDGPKKTFTIETLPKVSRLTTVLQKIELKKTKEICDKIITIQITKEDVQCQVEHLTAHLFCENMLLVGVDLSSYRGKRNMFLNRIESGLKQPKFLKRGPLGADVAKTLDPNAKAVEGEAVKEPEAEQSLEKVYDTANGDFRFETDDEDGDRGVLGDMVPRITTFVWCTNFNGVLMKFERLQKAPKVVILKMPAHELNMVHHPNMARHSKIPRLRTPAEQLKRDKNTLATRVTRARIQYHGEQIQLQAAYIEFCNIDCRRRNACLMVFLNRLLVAGGEGPRDFVIVIEKIMALQFMEGEDAWNKGGDDAWNIAGADALKIGDDDEDCEEDDEDYGEDDLIMQDNVWEDYDESEDDIIIDELVCEEVVEEDGLVLDDFLVIEYDKT
ncbi:unnamed protein product [Diamesa serratosioi]